MALSDLLSIFRRKPQGYATPWLQLTVVAAVTPDGVGPDQTYALRGRVITAGALKFDFDTPNVFVAFFLANDAGLTAANALAAALQSAATEQAVTPFGVAVQQGECLAQMRATGRLDAKPAGKVIAQAIAQATAMATSAANGATP